MSGMLLASVLKRVIRIGRLTLVDAAGRRHVFEGTPGPAASVRLHDPALHRKLLISPRLAVPEAYMDGTLTIEDGTLYDLIDVLTTNDTELDGAPAMRLHAAATRLMRRVYQYNPARRARRNVAHHYDLSDELYGLFLDRDRQYSCAYFRSPQDGLDTAQCNKKAHIAAKLLLRPGQRVLDIGSGWGGLALYLAAECGADVTGLTLSEEQLKVANRRAASAGLADRVRFFLRDYREETGRYDRIVSVGMFEHVGVGYYDAFFSKCATLLADDGVMVLHSIGRSEGPGVTNPWIAKYIFPGGYIPALSEVLPEIERAGLLVTDIEILRLHYAETLKAWRERFLAHREDAERIYDPRFVRMWEFYLAASEMSFREQNMMVMQIQLTKRQGIIPINRDYISQEERRFGAAESKRRPPLRLAGE